MLHNFFGIINFRMNLLILTIIAVYPGRGGAGEGEEGEEIGSASGEERRERGRKSVKERGRLCMCVWVLQS
jgi:hypothetical protein